MNNIVIVKNHWHIINKTIRSSQSISIEELNILNEEWINWLTKNDIFLYEYELNMEGDAGETTIFTFERAEDAIAFKLRWF